MKFIFKIFILILFAPSNLLAQHKNESSLNCGTDIINNDKYNQKRLEIFDQNIYDVLDNESRYTPDIAPPYILPVVIHVIHQNGIENISDDTILQGLEDLNEAFQNINYYDQGTGENTQIQFCLAKRLPNSNATTGIERINDPLTNVTIETEDSALKNLSQWDPYSYINIWLVKEICSNSTGCSVAGYAYYPTYHGTGLDGIVVEAKWFGSSKASSAVQVHEMGHYLGLYHTFNGGCLNNDCMVNGDKVCDTPPDNSTAPVPCGGLINSCNTDINSGFTVDQDDMYWNYMDYGYWDCYSAFTQGQKERMHAVIETTRNSLLESEGCNDPCSSSLQASFLPMTNQTIEVGQAINFTSSSTNAQNYTWKISGNIFAQSNNASYTFTEEGVYTITLEILNDDPNCYDEISIQVSVICIVETSFISSNFYPQPGEIVNFTSQSTGSINYLWTVDGLAVSNDENLSYSIPSQGNYTVCLSSNNNFCSDTYCQSIIALPIIEEPEFICNDTEPFVQIFAKDSTANDAAHCIVQLANGDILVGGNSGSKIFITKMSNAGVILWEKTIKSISDINLDKLITIYEDNEGNILLTGYGGIYATSNSAYIMKFTPDFSTMIWNQFIEVDYRLYETFEVVDDPDNYIVIGDSHFNVSPGGQDDAVFLKINKSTGALVGQPISYHLGTSEYFVRTKEYNGDLYSVGRITLPDGTTNKMRISLTKLTTSGAEVWTKLYPIAANTSARLYGEDLLIENDHIYFIGRGDDSGTSNLNTHGFFGRTNIDGDLDFMIKYNFDGLYFSFKNIKSLPDGFLIAGQYEENTITKRTFLLKIDKLGNVLWAKSINYDSYLDYYASSLLITPSNFYLAFTSGGDNSGRNYGIAKTDLNGETTDCNPQLDLDISSENLSQPQEISVNLTDYFNPLTLSSKSLSINEIDASRYTCGCDSIQCEDTYIKTLGSENQDEKGRKLLLTPEGNILIGGSKGDSSLLVLLDENEDVVWERTFKFVEIEEQIQDFFIDSDGYLVAIGRTKHLDTEESFFFKYDYNNDEIIWAKELVSTSLTRISAYSIAENTQGNGNYFISGETFTATNGCDAILLEVERNSGNSLWNNSFDLGNCEFFYKVLSISNSIYTFGRNAFPSFVNSSGYRGAISKFDQTGNQLWSKMYLVGDNQPARLYFEDAVEDNGIVTVGFGDLNGVNYNNYHINVVKTNYNGEIYWAKHYNVSPGNERAYSERIINLPDGFLITGRYRENNIQNLFLMKIDKLGEVLWTKSLGGDENDTGYDVQYNNGYLHAIGDTKSYNIQSYTNILLIKFDAEGNVNNNCQEITDLNVVAIPIDNPYQETTNLSQYQTNMNIDDLTKNSNQTNMSLNSICLDPCVQDSCDIYPDAFINKIQSNCLIDSMVLQFQICNIGGSSLPSTMNFVLYNSNPFNTNASIVHSGITNQLLLKDSCVIINLILEPFLNQQFYIIINIDPLTPTPFDNIDNYPNTTINECYFENNIDSFIVNINLPVLSLGPDTLICDNETFTFDAGPGFYSYLWSDNTTEQTMTAFGVGEYWVEVKDLCGVILRDTLIVGLIPQTQLELPQDLSICPGTIQLSVNGFEGYQWFPNELFDCDTCATVNVDVDESIEIIAVGNNPPGCYSVDTLNIYVVDAISYYDSINICFGSTANIFGNIENTEGLYTNMVTSGNGCDTTYNIYLSISNALEGTYEVTPSVESFENGTITTMISGGAPPYQYAWSNGSQENNLQDLASGVYTLSVTDSEGCDLILVIDVPLITEINLEIPNIFSPNQDNLNDEFGPYNLNYPLTNYSFTIFDRWGTEVFRTDDITNKWDGTYKGKNAPAEVYIYIIKYSYLNVETKVISGDVTLVR